MNPKFHITVPYQFQFFPNPTALICLSHDRARLFHVCAQDLQEITFLHTSDTDYQYSDKESFSHAKGSSTTFFRPGTEEHNKEHYLRVFLNYFADQFKKLDDIHRFSRVYIFLPGDMKHIVWDKIPTALRSKTHLIPGNVMNEHPLELLQRIEDSQ